MREICSDRVHKPAFHANLPSIANLCLSMQINTLFLQISLNEPCALIFYEVRLTRNQMCYFKTAFYFFLTLCLFLMLQLFAKNVIHKNRFSHPMTLNKPSALTSYEARLTRNYLYHLKIAFLFL